MASTTQPPTGADYDLESYQQSKTYVDGFSKRTVLGAFFVGLIMMPGSIYLSLVAGQSLGPAAEWVTIILFTELARRALTTLKKQEVYVLYYVAAGLAGGGIFAGLIRNQYLVQFPQAATLGIAQQIPHWACPPASSDAIRHRLLLNHSWTVPMLLLIVTYVLGKLNWFGMGYALFRITSDVERLPFPLAPIAAAGATALADATTKKESWRWSVFSSGAVLGIVFATIYIGLPSITGMFMNEPLQILPIPFAEFTSNTQNILPAALSGLSFDLGLVLWGMLIPFPIVIGNFIATMATSVFGNPILYHYGFFPHWHKGMGLMATKFTVDFDLWMSVGIGTALAVAAIGIVKVAQTLWQQRHQYRAGRLAPPEGRGDFPMWLAIGMFLFSSASLVFICHLLVPRFSMGFLIFFAFFWTPINSYISARMIGLAGAPVSFPYLREGSFILSGYDKVDIWFAPIPVNDFGRVTQLFRELELTGTKITSIIKAELLMFPIAIVCSLLFWAFFWYIQPIPSSAYPFAAKMWPYDATYRCLFMTATMGGGTNWLLKAIKLPYILGGFGTGIVAYGALSWFGAPILLFYGLISGIGNWPHAAIPQFIGAMLGRYYFQKRYGVDRWRAYTPVLCAGFACGMGLTSMFSVGLILIMKAVTALPF